jgi:hypothetical protein
MDNIELARELARRLNDLIEDEEVRRVLERLLEHRVSAPRAVAEHPTIQVTEDDKVGLLGFLNGVIGGNVQGGGGFLMAVFSNDRLMNFIVKNSSTSS